MSKTMWVVVLVVVGLVLVGGYAGRHKIKTLLMGSSPAPTVEVIAQPTTAPTVVPTGAMMEEVNNTWLKTSKDGYITDSKGMTLYTYDKDTVGSGKSMCTGGCLKAWPAYTTKTNTGLPKDVTAFQRSDDKTWQVAYKGWPLYYYASDVKVGDTTGDGVGGVWHLAKP